MICVIGIIGGSWLCTYERWGSLHTLGTLYDTLECVEYKDTLYRREAHLRFSLAAASSPFSRVEYHTYLLNPFSHFILSRCLFHPVQASRG